MVWGTRKPCTAPWVSIQNAEQFGGVGDCYVSVTPSKQAVNRWDALACVTVCSDCACRRASRRAHSCLRELQCSVRCVVVEPGVDLRVIQLARHATERERCNKRKSSATERAVS